jgi:hypothetical protein
MEDAMRAKLTLKLDDLSVDSFDTSPGQKGKGTVFGEQCTCPTNCTCPGCPSCEDTCAHTCVQTCDDATCAAWCTDTNYGCGTESCLGTDCGPYFCCV